jgi:hypothetical protein
MTYSSFYGGPGRPSSFTSVDCKFPLLRPNHFAKLSWCLYNTSGNMNSQQHQPDTYTKINNYGLGNGSSMEDTMHLDYSQVTGALEVVTRHNHPLRELRCHQVFILAEWL